MSEKRGVDGGGECSGGEAGKRGPGAPLELGEALCGPGWADGWPELAGGVRAGGLSDGGHSGWLFLSERGHEGLGDLKGKGEGGKEVPGVGLGTRCGVGEGQDGLVKAGRGEHRARAARRHGRAPAAAQAS